MYMWLSAKFHTITLFLQFALLIILLHIDFSATKQSTCWYTPPKACYEGKIQNFRPILIWTKFMVMPFPPTILPPLPLFPSEHLLKNSFLLCDTIKTKRCMYPVYVYGSLHFQLYFELKIVNIIHYYITLHCSLV